MKILSIGLAGAAFTVFMSCNNPGNSTQGELDKSEERKGVYGSGAEMEDFVRDVASSGKMEVEMADLALRKAKQREVLEMAERIKTDHSRANAQLKEIADNNNWDWPVNLLPEHAEELDRLENISSEGFDREYVNAMISSHQKAIRKLEAVSGGDETYSREGEGGSETDMDQSYQENMKNNTEGVTAGGSQNREKSYDVQQEDNGVAEGDREKGVIDSTGGLTQWIDNTLPVLREHLEHSERLAERL